MPSLSVICPILNEEKHLPLLFADINLCPDEIDLQFIDGGSKDYSVIISHLSGAKVSEMEEGNRGRQLNHGATKSKSDWLLFIHGDSRLDTLWSKKIFEIINKPLSKKNYWYFDFRIEGEGISFRLLEIAVYLRCKFLRTPYGDQGLLISKSLYMKSGGYSNLHIMEDLDLINRLNKDSRPKRIGLPIYTSGRKWQKVNIIRQALRNARFRYRWSKGEDSKSLLQDYYNPKIN